MGRMLALCGFEVQRVFKQPRSWVLMFLLPIFFTFVFGGITSTPELVKTKLVVVDEDGTLLSQALVEKLNREELYAVSLVQSVNEAQTLVQEKKAAGSVVVPKGYQENYIAGQKAEVVFQHGPDLAISIGIRQWLDDALAQTAVQMKATTLWSDQIGSLAWQEPYAQFVSAAGQYEVTVEAEAIAKGKQGEQMNSSAQRAVGFAIMFVMMSMLPVTGAILEARKSGVWYRMMAVPATRLQILGGYMLSFFVTGWLQFAILMGFSSVLFGVEWGNWFAQFVLVSAFLLCVVGLGMLIAGFVRSTEQQMAFGSLLILSTCMLGGVYWPLDIVSETMRKAADFTPQKWAIDGFTELIARGGGLGDVVGPVAVLLGFAVVFLVVGVKRVRYE
ncbi:ABC transporter permease [Tumebacillus permanentifrigoris]|uniref:ABC-2 type transport system permease protein n=1 Tax=Tumebacillus permanentifrigoris TaxID=378543 RepID=A0A316D298_9BACL|nr:ABC transporter permease [Tumebacillus permanentifrigoris]PWK03932.1 ABC-2 type transport system permease protein [Tumebacillus permanentifrigoris]